VASLSRTARATFHHNRQWTSLLLLRSVFKMSLPETHFADSHGLSIAYQVMGNGSHDVIIAPGMISHVELLHDFPGYTRYLRKLAEFARVITFDKRGQGLSDAMEGTPTLEERMDDLLAVMDHAGSKRACIVGFSEGGALAFLVAATHPSRVSQIVVFGAYGKACASLSYPHMHSVETRRTNLAKWVKDWGRGGGAALSVLAPHLAGDDTMCKMFARIERYASTPSAMQHYFEVNFGIDVLDVLPVVRTPVLVLHREDDLQVPASAGRHLADTLANASYVDCGAGGHLFWVGDTGQSLSEIRNFLTGTKPASVDESRVLSTVVMTDIAGSTETAERLGDAVWRDLLDRHDQISAEVVALHRGRLIKQTGDGIVATFDGSGRAVESAQQLIETLATIGLGIRVGIHAGEIELRGGDIGGLNVHIAARVMSLAGVGEILVTRPVVDLMVGSADFRFEDRGRQSLRGIPGDWEVFRAQR
jgi:class 3 adenylate cyclase/alpha-beta hydrolase superfamily lysophospholipase